MSIHKLVILKGQPPLDFYANAIPPIPPSSTLYIQNVTNADVRLSSDLSMSPYFELGDRTRRNSTSVANLEGEPALFVSCDNNNAELTIMVDNMISHVGGAGASASAPTTDDLIASFQYDDATGIFEALLGDGSSIELSDSVVTETEATDLWLSI